MKKISIFQYKCMAFLLPITMFFGIGLSNIVKETAESFWLSIIIGVVFGLIIVLGVEEIFTVDNEGIICKANKWQSFIYVLISIVFIMLATAILTNLIVSIYLTEVNPFIICLPLIIMMIYGAYKGEDTTAKISVILLIYCIILSICILLTLTREIKFTNFLPLFNTKPIKIISQSFNYAICSTTPLIILGVYGINNIENYKKNSLLKSYILSSLLILLIFGLTVGVLGVNMTELYRYPEYIVLKKISLFQFINNIENFMAFFWILIYIIFILLSGSFMKNSLENLSVKKWIFPTISLLILVVLYFTFFKQINYLLFLYKYQTYILSGCLGLFILINIKNLIK